MFIREGGSIPFVRTIADATGKPCLLMGFGQPDENAHAPNEWLDLENYHLGHQERGVPLRRAGEARMKDEGAKRGRRAVVRETCQPPSAGTLASGPEVPAMNVAVSGVPVAAVTVMLSSVLMVALPPSTATVQPTNV